MPTSLSHKKQQYAVPDRPERFGPSLAHVITIENDKDVVLGQAWLAGTNTLVTCGHVVEKFVGTPSSLMVKFPASGNCYTVREVRLHPNFARQADQLVRFDAAVLLVELQFPEREAAPLPIEYEKVVSINQEYSAIRYPVHLGQFTSSPNSLAQIGRMLGPLRKNDNFHLLHDLALAPGDSGCPIFDGNSVIALHCGDTATLPGLNLPTTSIRLALWVDALRDLGVEENLSKQQTSQAWNLALAALAFLVTFFLALPFFAWQFINSHGEHVGRWLVHNPDVMPITVSFDNNFNLYQYGDPIKIAINSPGYLSAFCIDDEGRASQLLTNYSQTKVTAHKQKLLVFAFKNGPDSVYDTAKTNPHEPTELKSLEKKNITDTHLEERDDVKDLSSVAHLVLDLPWAEPVPQFVLDATKPNAQPAPKP